MAELLKRLLFWLRAIKNCCTTHLLLMCFRKPEIRKML